MVSEIPSTPNTIVLDLDSTLINTADHGVHLKDLGIFKSSGNLKLRRRIYQFPLETGPHEEVYWGVIRPGAQEFLRFCFQYFRYVVVWTAAKRAYADAIVEVLFRGLPRPHLVWAYENCAEETIRGRKERTKPLRELIQKSGLPGLSLNNIYALDDNPVTYRGNVANALPIPAYSPSHKSVSSLSKEDNALPSLQKWLLQDGVVFAPDVRRIGSHDKTVTIDGEPYPLDVIRADAFSS